MARWAQGIQAGNLVNKSSTKCSLWDTNSNAVANSLGNWMGFDVQRISDTRTDAAQPFIPGIGTNLLGGPAASGTQQSPFIENRESVGLNSLVRDEDGNEPEPAPFRDPFRTDIPF